jgi:iron complex transport system ATP-binding protein
VHHILFIYYRKKIESGEKMTVIKIDKLNWKYAEKEIIKDVDLQIERGKFYAIVGPNGSGKTTLLKNILRHLEPSANKVFIDGKDLIAYGYKELAMQLASVPQNTQLSYDFSAYDVVMMGRSPYIKRFSSETKEDSLIVKKAMDLTDTWQLRDANIQEISGGERQRVIIARAIAQQTNVMLLDEPISNLDMNHQIQVLDTVKRLCNDHQLTVVTVLHDLNIASQYADEIIFVKDGQVLEAGYPERVLRKELIDEVYGSNFHIMDNPITRKPLIIPLSKMDM